MGFQQVDLKKESGKLSYQNKESKKIFISSTNHKHAESEIKFRIPNAKDGANVFELIKQCSPLEINSLYCYLLQCRHFFDTCVVAEKVDQVVGFLSGYRKPQENNIYFIWQIAVHPGMRGQGIAMGMIQWVLSSFSQKNPVQFVEASVTTTNNASLSLFKALARELNTTCVRTIFLSHEDFGSQSHEDEWLLRIGPFSEGTFKIQ